MNEHGFTKENLLRSLPISLAGDPSMVALAEAIAGLLVQHRQEIDRLSIYPHIEKLDEALLDILAHDFKVDWWDSDYTLEEKRRTLQSSWQVHKTLGTKAAVETAIRAIYPATQVNEWFEYGGEPYHFKLNINITHDDVDVGKQRRVMDRLEYYKNLRSHLDGVEYFMVSETALACAGAVLLSSSQRAAVTLQPDAHWPRSEIRAAAGGVFLASSGVCSVDLPAVEARWPQVGLEARSGGAFLAASGVCTVKLPPIETRWPKVKLKAQAGGVHLGTSEMCSVKLPQITLNWPRVKLPGTGGAAALGQHSTCRVAVKPQKLSWPQSKATTKFGVSVLGVYQTIKL